MICFEVYRNGEKLCTAGVGEFGTLTALVHWTCLCPDAILPGLSAAMPALASARLALCVGGLGRDDSPPPERLKWVDSAVSVGDEIRIRVVEAAEPDPPRERRWEDSEEDVERNKEYIRQRAKDFGWEVVPGSRQI